MTKTLEEAFRHSMMCNPIASRKAQMDAFVEEMKSDPAYLEMLAVEYFERRSETRLVVGNQHNYALVRTGASMGRSKQISESLSGKPRPRSAVPSRQVTMTLAQMEAQREFTTVEAPEDKAEGLRKALRVALLDLTLPDGKSLRFATGAECVKAGGFYAAVGKALKPSHVVDKHLTEGDLQNIRARFYQANETA